MIVDTVEESRQTPWHLAANAAMAEVEIHCRDIGYGKEDWNRGFRELQRAYLCAGCVARLPDGSVRLGGLPFGDLLLNGSEAAHILKFGLLIASPDFEAEILAADFRCALYPHSGANNVVKFQKEERRHLHATGRDFPAGLPGNALKGKV